MAARAMAPAALEAGLEPVAAPSGSTNFAGIAATGWIPPDCTMAAGPQHVLLSVNSSMAIYSKAGGAPVLQRTLTQWFSNVVQGICVRKDTGYSKSRALLGRRRAVLRFCPDEELQ